jgi:hypothetical protein
MTQKIFLELSSFAYLPFYSFETYKRLHCASNTTIIYLFLHKIWIIKIKQQIDSDLGHKKFVSL